MLKVSTADILVLNINMACINLRFENLNYHKGMFCIFQYKSLLSNHEQGMGYDGTVVSLNTLQSSKVQDLYHKVSQIHLFLQDLSVSL